MHVHVVIDGRYLGSLEYELPKDSNGRAIQCPSAEYKSRLTAIVHDGDQAKWIATADLERE